MKKYRLLSCILCLALIMSTVSVFAAPTAGFADVDNDPTVTWAKPYIDQMTSAGYIKGYEDGTFKPKRAISKLECLLLMSRMLGVEENNYSDIAAKAVEIYGNTAKKYNTQYVNEICYLLYNGILDENDLVAYASSANANTELLRYQAATLMAKLLGRDTQAKAYTASKATYADDSKIPSAYKGYVEYVTYRGVMNGMDSDANGNPQFSPSTSLNRAQMATLLARMIEKIGKKLYIGEITDIDTANKTISIDNSSYSINEDTIVHKDDKAVTVAELVKGDEVTAIEVDKHLQSIMVTANGTPAEDNGDEEEVASATSIYAIVSSTNESSSGKKMTLADPEDAENKQTYTAAENCQFIINKSSASFGDMKKGTLVKATIDNGKLIRVESVEKSLSVSGTLSSVEFDDDNHVYITLTDTKGNAQMYVVSNKGATVNRDGVSSEYRELAKGDAVKLQLTNGKVVTVSATSNAEKFSGVLSAIIIATRPQVTLIVDGVEETYYLRADAKITVAGTEATVYDLRPNVTVTGTFDGDEVKTIVASTVATNSKGEFTGTVSAINTTYKVMTVTDNEGEEQSVYYNSETNFLKSDGKSANAKDIEKGATLSITGADSNGVFVATIVIIK